MTTQLLFQAPGTSAPQGTGLSNEAFTNDATPVAMQLGNSAIPPVISELGVFQLIAREIATGDTKSWLIAVQIRSVPGGVTIQGPVDIVPAFEDPSPQPWTYSIVPNSPGPNQVQFLVTGEAGKSLKWTLRATVGLNIAF